jgi:hypothetical protein
MSPTQRKRRGKRGRPKVAKQREQDAARLRAALEAFGWKSQQGTALHAGIDQRAFNALVNGKRDLGREDLRALAKIGVSADYLLGLTKELIPPGETRTVAGLERDVASRVWREVCARVMPPAGAPMWQSFVTYWRTDGAAVLRQAVEREVKAFHDASSGLEDFRERARELLEQRRSQIANAAGIPSFWPEKGTSSEQRKATQLQLRKRIDSLSFELAYAYQQAEFARRINESGAALIHDPEIIERQRAELAKDTPRTKRRKL